MIGAAILVLGLAASAFVAAEWHSSLQRADRKSFSSTAAYLSSAVESQLNANYDLTRAMRGIATLEPNASETRFQRWYSLLEQGSTPLTGDAAAALIQSVPAAQLGAYRRAAEADPAFRALIGGKFQVVPPGHRAVYCLARAAVGGAVGG
jgi:hypothetical protein